MTPQHFSDGSQAHDSGTFTMTGTGFTASVTGTARWILLRDHVTLDIPMLSGTSNSGDFTLTGMPAAIYPMSAQHTPLLTGTNAAAATSLSGIVGTDGVITLGQGNAGNAFSAILGKGIDSVTITYSLVG